MMREDDHCTLNITAYRYIPISKLLLRINLDESAIHLCHNVINDYYTASCVCGMTTTFESWRYLTGLPLYGGNTPRAGFIGVVFGPRHRWVRLHCSGCRESQWYFHEDELGNSL